MRNQEIRIDGYTMIVDQVEQIDESYVRHDSKTSEKVRDLAADEITQAIQPALSIIDSIRKMADCSSPDEMEASMQFAICLRAETPILKVMSGEASAQFAVRFLWKRED